MTDSSSALLHCTNAEQTISLRKKTASKSFMSHLIFKADIYLYVDACKREFVTLGECVLWRGSRLEKFASLFRRKWLNSELAKELLLRRLRWLSMGRLIYLYRVAYSVHAYRHPTRNYYFIIPDVLYFHLIQLKTFLHLLWIVGENLKRKHLSWPTICIKKRFYWCRFYDPQNGELEKERLKSSQKSECNFQYWFRKQKTLFVATWAGTNFARFCA